MVKLRPMSWRGVGRVFPEIQGRENKQASLKLKVNIFARKRAVVSSIPSCSLLGRIESPKGKRKKERKREKKRKKKKEGKKEHVLISLFRG